jgi:4-hydroxythreonine-4-phosphate dehydrogenase
MLLAIADDLTGALACAAEARRAGRQVELRRWDAGRAAAGAIDVLVLDTASRLETPAVAAERVRAALAAGRDALGADATLYKRVDSGLRGNVAAELEAMRATTGLPLLLAPAAPAWGITTEGGVQRIDGAPVSAAAYDCGAEVPAAARARAWLEGPTRELSLGEVRDRRLPALLQEACDEAASVVCDAASASDLARIAAAQVSLARPVVLVGSYGLAGAVLAPGAPERLEVLVVAGSLQGVSRAQVEALRDEGARGVHVLVEAAPAGNPDRAVARRLADAAVARVRERAPAGLVLVGGETAAATLAAAGVERIEVLAEPWPATPVVRLAGGVLDGLPAIVKSGARGDARWLVHAVDLLRRTIA